MEPTNFYGANTNMGPPEGISEDTIRTIRAYVGENGEGSGEPVVITAWKPTREELEAMSEGKPVFLFVWGAAMPPVLLTTTDPFPQPNQ